MNAYLRFTAMAFGLTLALVLLGLPFVGNLAGTNARGALIAGCSASLFASLVGALPTLLARRKLSSPMVIAFGSMALRLAVILGLGLVLLLSGAFPRKPLLLSVALSYVALLPLDTRFVLRSAMEAVPEPGLERT